MPLRGRADTGRATPSLQVTQEQSFQSSGYQGDGIRRLFLNTGIDFRHFYFENALRLDDATDERLASDPSRDRCTLLPGSFLEAVPPGADVYLMSGVIHDWDEAHAMRILRNCQGSMAQHSRVLVIECVVPEGPDSSFSKLLDLNMLVMNGGRERAARK